MKKQKPIFLVITKVFPDGNSSVEIQQNATKPKIAFQSLPDMDIYYEWFTNKKEVLKVVGESLGKAG